MRTETRFFVFAVALLTTASSLHFAACGGGGGGGSSDSTDPDLVFQVFPPNNFAAGASESFNLSGTSTAGGHFTATVSDQTGSQTTFQGEAAIPIESLFRFTNTDTKVSVTVNGTSYFSASNHSRLLGEFIITLNTTCLALGSVTVPATAQAGDFGIAGTLSCDDGTSSVLSWELQSASRTDRANLVITTVEKDAFDRVTSTEDDTYEIDTSGVRYRFKIRYSDDDVTINLSS